MSRLAPLLLATFLVQPPSFGQATSGARVDTGIANSGNLRIEGNVSINVRVESRAEDLALMLEGRADSIRKQLSVSRDPQAARFLAQFNELHQRHVALLKAGNLAAAHEVLSQIHQLSFTIFRSGEAVAIGQRIISYYCSMPRYVRGELIEAYMTGPDEVGRDQYPLAAGERAENDRGRPCGPKFVMAAPLDVEAAYSTLLEQK